MADTLYAMNMQESAAETKGPEAIAPGLEAVELTTGPNPAAARIGLCTRLA
jgi:hypothetical protein